jgi:hypothetical protein
MMNIGWLSRLSNPQHFLAMTRRMAAGIGVAILLTMTGIAVAQIPTPGNPNPAPVSTDPVVPDGFTIHQSIDFGGHLANIKGSGAMYDTLVNIQSGPRMLGQTFEMRALPGNKHPLFDIMSGFTSGYGGDPNGFTKLDFSKGKLYEFSGIFRRDRQYFDYDLLGNPNVPSGESIPVTGSATPYAWPQVRQSPFMFNTVRRMTDTNLTILPLSKVTFRAGYSQNIFQGPSLTPSGYQIGGSLDVLLQEMQRNSTDDFTGGIDWKPIQGTKLTFEEEVDHYKGDSYFRMAPGAFNVQEADGSRVALFANYDALTPYAASACNTTSMGGGSILTASSNGGVPIINAACAVITSYTRKQPIRTLFPTEIFRLQSTSVKNISMNGNVRYTKANMSMPNYYDDFQGLTKATREATYLGNASAKRQVIAGDYGVTWQASKKFTVSDQISYSSAHQPGTSVLTSDTTVTIPVTAPNETINNPGLITTVINTATTPATAPIEGTSAIATPQPGYFGQSFLVNNLTGSWDVTDRASISLTYRASKHVIAQGIPHSAPLATGATSNGTVTINESGGILNFAYRPATNWDMSGTVEILSADNAFTPVGARQSKHYRVHTTYRPNAWTSVSGAYNDLERHNNTNNIGGAPGAGPLAHVDHSRVGSLGVDMAPNEHYGLNFNYAYSDVYSATNICYDGGATAALPVAAAPANGAGCPGATVRGATYLEFGPVKDFMDAPTQSASVALALSPVARLKSHIGYRLSSVNGSRFFNDPRDVNGSLVSSYQSPFVNLAWTVRKGIVWNGEYNYFGYGEGGVSGSQYCSTSTTLPSATTAAPVVLCSTLPNTAMSGPAFGFTAPRNFHANNVTLGMHYEF